jgi:hypothetical protein
MANLKGFYRDESAKRAQKIKPITLSALKAKIEQDPNSLNDDEHRIYDAFMQRVHHGIKPEPRPEPKVVRI